MTARLPRGESRAGAKKARPSSASSKGGKPAGPAKRRKAKVAGKSEPGRPSGRPRARRRGKFISPFTFILAGLFAFAVAVFVLDFLQARYGRSSVGMELYTWAQNKGLFSPGKRELESESLRKAVNEALLESGIHKSDMAFEKSVAAGTADEYEYREFDAPLSARLDLLRAALAKKASGVGANVVAFDESVHGQKRILAIDLGFGRVKRQCLLFTQPMSGAGAGPARAGPPISAPPKVQPVGSRATVASGTAEVAIIVDDCGYNLALAKRLVQLDCPLTLSIMPMTPFAGETARAANAAGDEVMLHLPLEPVERLDPHIPEVEIKCGQGEREVANLIGMALANVPYVKGVNNHEGSKACADPVVMRFLMDELKKRDLYFIDSRTSAETVAYSVAKSVALKASCRDVFIDNENDRQAIKAALKRLLALSIRLNRPAIGICHLRRPTVAVLEEELPVLRERGCRFLFASDVVK